MRVRALAGALVAGAAFAAFAGVAGCNGKTTAATGGSTHATAQAICAYLESCDRQVFYVYAADLDGCVAVYEAKLAHQLALPDVGESQAFLDGCTAVLDTTSCNVDVAPQCGRPPPGARAPGATCESSLQCSTNTCEYGGPGGSGACGTCATPSRTPLGQPCTSTIQCLSGNICSAGKCSLPGAVGASCSADTDCVPSAACAAGVCVAVGNVGASCGTPSTPCSSRTICDPTAKTCKPRGAVGAPCTADAACDKARGTRCDLPSSKCVAMDVTPVAIGGACSTDFSAMTTAFAPCVDGSTCVVSSPGSAAGTCVAFLGVDAACDTSTGQCGPSLVCMGGKCVAETSCN